MILADLGDQETVERLERGDLIIRSGPFKFRLNSSIDLVAEGLSLLYANYPVYCPESFTDFSISLDRGTGIHRWWRQQVRFRFDGHYPFEPLPISHSYPQLEWAMNWCISSHAHFFLILHAAVIERNGYVAIMPAPPGSGKSTLCAALIHRGWRLFSDELALFSLKEVSVSPLTRPVSLKNNSIEIIGSYAPDAIFNRVTHDTAKGTVTHMKINAAHIASMDTPATPRWFIFPKYIKDSKTVLKPLSKGESMIELGRNAFNYSVLGLRGFNTLANALEISDCYQFNYSNLDEAVATFDRLASQCSSPING